MELERVPKGLGMQAQITFALRPVVSFNSAATEVEADDCVKIMEIEIIGAVQRSQKPGNDARTSSTKLCPKEMSSSRGYDGWER
jgi:hypothetical protein